MAGRNLRKPTTKYKITMNYAYFVNQYPKVSHSFIRREILALEELGLNITRYSIRSVPVAELADKNDIKEHSKTLTLLDTGLITIFVATLKTLVTSPSVFFLAMLTAISLGQKSQRGVLRHLIYLAEACLLKQKLKQAGISHIHAHFGTNSTTVAMLCKLIGGPKYSFTVHGPEEFDDPVGLSLSKKIDQSTFVVAVSSFGRSQLMRQCPHTQWHKIKVVHCAVDDSFMQTPETPLPNGPRLVCVGRLCEQKGQLLLLEALKKLDNRGIDFEMTLAGDGEMRAMIEARIQEYGLEKKVHITGWISGDQVRRLILDSRAMVLPSFAEGLPVVIMESLALQRPVISTYVAGIPELVKNGENGWLIPAGSIEDLVIALKEVLAAEPEQLHQMGKKGAIRVQEHHNALIEAGKLRTYFEA
jgi:glycosyltransferase involved in cell wall biosynthesis